MYCFVAANTNLAVHTTYMCAAKHANLATYVRMYALHVFQTISPVFLLHITNLLAVQTKKKGTKLLKPRTKASGPAKAKAERKPVASEKTIKEV